MYGCLKSDGIHHKITFEYQFSFQKGKPNHTALITLVQNISEAFGKGFYIIWVFPDFQKHLTLSTIAFFWRKCSIVAYGA